jgi:ferritin-like protein
MPASTTLHEPAEELSVQTIDMHRAVVSLMEELDAVDWYNQRAAACKDAQLRAILEHNRDEEIEHATMTLEWIRRHMPKFDEALKTYLFTRGDITKIEEEVEKSKAENGKEDFEKVERNKPRLTVGMMKDR